MDIISNHVSSEIILPRNKDNYLAFFDDSNEAFISTGNLCWKLYRDWLSCIRTKNIDDYKFPFEYNAEDRKNMYAWFTLARDVEKYSCGFYNLSKKVSCSHINPWDLCNAKPCTRCWLGPLVPVSRTITALDLVRAKDLVCIACLCSS